MTEKNKFYTKWWFWAIIGVAILGIIGSLFSNSSTDSTNQDGNIQNIKSSLEIIDLSCEYGDYGWIYVKGRVKNSGNEEETFVKVNIDLYNNDEWIKSDFTYVRNTDILAGATDSFEKTWTDDSIVFTKCEAYATSYADSLSPTISKENNEGLTSNSDIAGLNEIVNAGDLSFKLINVTLSKWEEDSGLTTEIDNDIPAKSHSMFWIFEITNNGETIKSVSDCGTLLFEDSSQYSPIGSCKYYSIVPGATTKLSSSQFVFSDSFIMPTAKPWEQVPGSKITYFSQQTGGLVKYSIDKSEIKEL